MKRELKVFFVVASRSLPPGAINIPMKRELKGCIGRCEKIVFSDEERKWREQVTDRNCHLK
jgi:hypothetical protein